MPNQFLSPEGDLENYFVSEYWLIDQYVGDQLWTWGLGTSGRLGNGVTTGNRSTPVTTFAGGTDWKQVAAGTQHTAAVKTDGTLWTWGLGTSGRLGDATITNSSTPVTTFAGGTDWKQVSAGGSHTAAVKTDGTLWTWGLGTYGRLGNSLLTNRSTPVTTFAGGNNWKQVSAGNIHTAAVKTDGTLWTWGAGTIGRLGDATLTNSSTPVTTFAGGSNWKQVAAGGSHTAAVKTDGTLWTWGDGGSGPLGNATLTSTSTPVTTFAGGTNWKQVAAGDSYTAAIKTDGTLWTWGSEGSGRLGRFSIGTTKITPVTTFAGGTNWADTETGESDELYTLSAGTQHTAAIKTDGTLWTWGNGLSGRLGTNDTTDRSTPVTTFAGGTNWKQVAAGTQHTAAVKTDGTLWTWGNGLSGRLGKQYSTTVQVPVRLDPSSKTWADTETTPFEPDELYTLSAGTLHTAAVKTDGTLWTWGNGLSGRLGDATLTNSSTPVTTFAGGSNWKQVAAGYQHTAAVKTDGTLWTWGAGTIGRLGDATLTNRSTPVTTFAGGTNWKQVSAGDIHTAAIKTDGTLWTWGAGSSGRLGDATITNSSTPVTTFAGGTDWKQVSAGDSHTAAVKTDGTLWTWGNGVNGRLGDATLTNSSTPVTTFAGGTDWKQVSAGTLHTAAVKTDGTLWTWGNGLSGRLGDATLTNSSTPVTTFAGGTDWKQVSAGDSHTAAIKTDGTLWTWGNGGSGRLGNSLLTNRSTPVTTFAGGTDWKQVSAGGSHTVALRDDGVDKELFTFGLNTSSQLGISVPDIIPGPVFSYEDTWKQVTTGYSHTAAIKTDGTLWTWGNGLYGRLGDATVSNSSTPVTTFAGGTNWKQVSAGDFHTAAVKTDGTLWTWGFGAFGRLGNSLLTNRSTPVTTFAGGTDWKQVAAGFNHTAAVKTDGTLWTWGNGGSGRLGNSSLTDRSTPVTTFAGGTNWKQISSGTGHTAAIKTDGTLWTWGNGESGRLGTNDNTPNRSTPVTTFAGGTDWKQVSAGGFHTVALRDDGVDKELFTFGNNGNGQLGENFTSDDFVPNQTFAGGTNWKQVSAGDSHTAAVKTDGTLWTWGNGLYGRLGDATITNSSTPVTAFAGGTNWKQVSAGFNHTAAVQAGTSADLPLS
jgi:alpha-tubulin suppressor-like RCC1 family protein